MKIWLGKDIPKQNNELQIKSTRMVKNRLGYVRPNHQKLFRRLCFFKAINDNSPRILHDIHLFQSLIKMHCSRFGILSRAVANGGAGGALDPPTFGQAVNPISTRGGADYPHFSITSPPPGISDRATGLLSVCSSR